MASLNEFISSVKTTGLMKTNRFAVTFSLPAAMPAGSYSTDLRNILLFCDNVNLPGVTLETTSAKTYGEHREMPYNRLFETINMGFYVDNTMAVKLLFDSWISAVQDPVTRNFNYYKDYTTDVVIDVYDVAEMNRYQVTLYQCYPKSLSAITMDYANKDVMKMSVAMQYKYWMSSPTMNISSNNPFVGSAMQIPTNYFTNFNSFQTGLSSFENARTSLFSAEAATVGFGSLKL